MRVHVCVGTLGTCAATVADQRDLHRTIAARQISATAARGEGRKKHRRINSKKPPKRLAIIVSSLRLLKRHQVFVEVGGAGADGVKRVEIIYFLIAKKLAVVCFLRARRIEKSFCFYRTSKITRAQKISPRVIIQ